MFEEVRCGHLDARARGTAVLFISEELDEILEMSDRVVVMYEGRINAEFSGDFDRDAVGRAMGLALDDLARLPPCSRDGHVRGVDLRFGGALLDLPLRGI